MENGLKDRLLQDDAPHPSIGRTPDVVSPGCADHEVTRIVRLEVESRGAAAAGNRGRQPTETGLLISLSREAAADSRRFDSVAASRLNTIENGRSPWADAQGYLLTLLRSSKCPTSKLMRRVTFHLPSLASTTCERPKCFSNQSRFVCIILRIMRGSVGPCGWRGKTSISTGAPCCLSAL